MTVHTRSLKEIAILNKDLVLGGPPPLMDKDHTFAIFNFWTLPLAKQGFQSTTLLDQSFEKMLAEMKEWKKEALKDENPEALLFYFCGHGG